MTADDVDTNAVWSFALRLLVQHVFGLQDVSTATILTEEAVVQKVGNVMSLRVERYHLSAGHPHGDRIKVGTIDSSALGIHATITTNNTGYE